MTRLQQIKKNFEIKYKVKATAKHAREFLGFDIPGRGNSKKFWFEVSHRIWKEEQSEWRANQWRREYNEKQATNAPQHPTFANIFNAARARGYSFNEAETLANKATAMLKSNPQRAYKLFLNRLNIA